MDKRKIVSKEIYLLCQRFSILSFYITIKIQVIAANIYLRRYLKLAVVYLTMECKHILSLSISLSISPNTSPTLNHEICYVSLLTFLVSLLSLSMASLLSPRTLQQIPHSNVYQKDFSAPIIPNHMCN